MIDVFAMTRAARLRRLREPSARTRPPAGNPIYSDVFPQTAVPPEGMRRTPSALESLMRRHDRVNERHLR